MNNYTIPIFTAVILIIAVLGFGGYFYYQSLDQAEPSIELPSQIELAPDGDIEDVEIIAEVPNPIDESIRNPLSIIQNPLNDLDDDLLDEVPDSSLDDVDYNPFL